MEKIKRAGLYFKRHYYWLSSLLMFMSYPSFDSLLSKGFPFFAWFSFVPLFLFIKRRDLNLKEVFFYTFITGLLGNYLTYRWIGHFGANVPGGSAVIMAFLMPLLSLFLGLKLLIAEFFSRRYRYLRILIYPSAWLFIDWVQSIGHLAFPWPYLGYSQYPFTCFIQISSLGGILGITFIMIATAWAVTAFVDRAISERITFVSLAGSKEAAALYAMIFLIIAGVLFGMLRMSDHGNKNCHDLRVALVQSCISPWDNWRTNRFDYLNELKGLTDRALMEDPDFIIWSESATLETISYDYESGRMDGFALELLEYVRSMGRPLLTGEIGIAEEWTGIFPRRYPLNSAVYINSNGEVVMSYDKIHLVPFGEWFPYEEWFPFVKRIVSEFGGSAFVPGDEPVIFSIDNNPFGVLICYEGIFYRLCRTYKKLGVRFLVNITNDGWTDTYSGHMQHFSASVFRAIENGIWYIRAGNTGLSTLIDPFGRIQGSLPILQKGYVAGNIDFSLNHETFYSRHGDIILHLSMAFLGLLMILCFVQSLLVKKK